MLLAKTGNRSLRARLARGWVGLWEISYPVPPLDPTCEMGSESLMHREDWKQQVHYAEPPIRARGFR